MGTRLQNGSKRRLRTAALLGISAGERSDDNGGAAFVGKARPIARGAGKTGQVLTPSLVGVIDQGHRPAPSARPQSAQGAAAMGGLAREASRRKRPELADWQARVLAARSRPAMASVRQGQPRDLPPDRRSSAPREKQRRPNRPVKRSFLQAPPKDPIVRPSPEHHAMPGQDDAARLRSGFRPVWPARAPDRANREGQLPPPRFAPNPGSRPQAPRGSMHHVEGRLPAQERPFAALPNCPPPAVG